MLPNELLLAIVEYADVQTLARMKVSSRLLREVVMELLRVFMKSFPSMITKSFTRLSHYISAEIRLGLGPKNINNQVLQKALLYGMSSGELTKALQKYRRELIVNTLRIKSFRIYVLESIVKRTKDTLYIRNNNTMIITRFNQSGIDSLSYCVALDSDPRTYEVCIGSGLVHSSNYICLLYYMNMNNIRFSSLSSALCSLFNLI